MWTILTEMLHSGFKPRNFCLHHSAFTGVFTLLSWKIISKNYITVFYSFKRL